MFPQSLRRPLSLFLIVSCFPSTELAAQSTDNAASIYLELFEQLPKNISEEQQAVLSNWKEVELSEDARNLVRLYAPAMKSLHQAAVIKNCDWSIRPKPQGPFPTLGLMEYMVKGREIVNAVCLSSRIGFEGKENRGAVDDLLDLLAFSRYFARGNTMTDSLTSQVFETNATELLATYLPEIRDPQVLKVIVQRYDALPDVVPLKEIFLNEKKTARTLMDQAAQMKPEKQFSEKEKKEVQGIFTQTDAQADEMATIVSLPLGKQEAAIVAFEQKYKGQPGVGATMARTWPKVIRGSNVGHAQRALFRAALAISVNGPEELKKHPDPFGSGPFEYQKRESGFELKSKLKNGRGEQVTLKVGK